jgi:dolichol kinase
LVIQALVLVNGALQKRAILPTYITRKIIHLLAAPLFVVCWLLYAGSGGSSRYFALVVPLAFILQFTVIGLGWRKDEAFVNSMSRQGDPRELLGGTLYYAVVMLICALFFFNAGDLANPVALYVFGALAGGDGLADIVGRRFGGTVSFGFGGARKTLVGSLAMFAGSVLMILVLAAIFGTGMMLTTIVLLSLLATVVEALTPSGYDNITIAAAVLIGIMLLQAMAPALWPYGPLLTL